MIALAKPAGAVVAPTEEAWLRQRARDLIDDPALAEDLVQEVFLEVVRSPCGTIAHRRAWMSRVLRNRLLRVQRTRTRLQRREEAAARDERLPAADASLERVETGFEVKEAILALDWSDRETLFLTHYRDFGTRDLASHWAVPLATAKSRVRRAEERLRERLVARGTLH